MKKNSYTLTISRPDHGTEKRVQIPRSLAYSLVAACLVGMIILAVFSVNFARMAIKVAEFNRLRSEVYGLRSQTETYQTFLWELGAKISALEVLAQKVRTVGGFERSVVRTEVPSITPFIEELSSTVEVGKMPPVMDVSSQIDERLSRLAEIYTHSYLKLTYTPSIWPVAGFIFDRFGVRDNGRGVGAASFHRGIDIAATIGEPVLAPAEGSVVSAEYHADYGRMVVLRHHFGITTVYAHLSGFQVSPGQRVKRGQVIGWVGNTGRTTGPHLHYEVRVQDNPVNPLRFVSQPS